MQIEAVHFKGHRCFKSSWSGFSQFKPLNVVIGRNNSGKSQLLDLVDALCEGKLWRDGWTVRCSGILSESVLQRSFRQGASGGPLGRYDHWNSHGKYLIGAHVSWEVAGERHIQRVEFTDAQQADAGLEKNQSYGELLSARTEALKDGLLDLRPELARKVFQRLAAERDIQPESAGVELTLSQEGRGATNIIRRYLNTADARYPRELIRHELLGALNEVFGPDGEFTEITVRHHDDSPPSGISKDSWEVFLGEERKGLVALSRSGSGLKTVILVLLHLLVVPEFKGRDRSEFVFAFEELENNLHPALLRRLFKFIESYALQEKVTVFLTTHSSTALDFFGLLPHAQIIHVLHDGQSATTQPVAAHFDKLGVISELGAKPSDLLQANGIIWVEGPSDCIYVNRWVGLFSNGELQEGRD